MNRREAGFTLIELLVAVAIVGILVTIAAASYQEHIRRSARADAKAVLLEDAAWLERFYTTNGRYDQTTGGAAVALPFTQSPKDGAARYNISFSAKGAQSYTLQATPTGSFTDPECGTLTLTHTGVKGSDGPVETCWNR